MHNLSVANFYVIIMTQDENLVEARSSFLQR